MAEPHPNPVILSLLVPAVSRGRSQVGIRSSEDCRIIDNCQADVLQLSFEATRSGSPRIHGVNEYKT